MHKCFYSTVYATQKSSREATPKYARNGSIASQSSTEARSQNATNGNIEARNFTFRELAAATKNFRSECLLGEGGFGRVYKGRLENLGQVKRNYYSWCFLDNS